MDRDKASWTASDLGTKASKHPSAAKKPTVEAVQYVQTVQVVESFEGSGNGTHPSVLAQEIVEDLEAALEQFRKIATESVGISSEIRPLDKISVNEG